MPIVLSVYVSFIISWMQLCYYKAKVLFVTCDSSALHVAAKSYYE